ncbi:hypothetical protein HMPREF0262_00764 [Clostridium sp. ATCC 29733]|nr:hypothetical protein HMPREF0262_00764 [Clostridium sp. ATCC 29733]
MTALPRLFRCGRRAGCLVRLIFFSLLFDTVYEGEGKISTSSPLPCPPLDRKGAGVLIGCGRGENSEIMETTIPLGRQNYKGKMLPAMDVRFSLAPLFQK